MEASNVSADQGLVVHAHADVLFHRPSPRISFCSRIRDFHVPCHRKVQLAINPWMSMASSNLSAGISL